MRPPPKRSALTTGKNPQKATSNVFSSVTPSARKSSDASAAVDVYRNPSQGKEDQGSSGVSYRVGDVVLVRTPRKPTKEATIVKIDPFDASRFNVAFKDKRKKGGWRSQNDLTPLVPAATTSKNKFQHKARARTDAGTNTGVVNEISVPSDNSKTVPGTNVSASSTVRLPDALVAAPTTKTTAAATSEEASTGAKTTIPEKKDDQTGQTTKKSPPAKEGRPRKRKNGKIKATIASGAVEINEGSAENAGAFGGGASQQGPPLNRATAAMAKTRSSTIQQPRRSQERRDAGGSAIGTVGEINNDNSAENSDPKGKENAKTPASSTAMTGKIYLKPPGEGWQRPKIVLPGNRDGSPEPALRVEHLSEFVRPQKAFKIHHQRVEAKLKKYARIAQSQASTSPKTAASRRPALRRPLYQPSYSLEELKRGITVNPAGTLIGADCDNLVDSRRGRRARKQFHPSLSEDKMAAAAFGGVESDDDAYGEEGYESSSGRCPGDGKNQGEERATRFLMSADAPWGNGDVPRIKAALTLQEDGAPFSADRSAIVVVSFPTDRHHHSGEQLTNVLTARKFLCYHNGQNKVFVLTDRKETEQKAAMERVRELALTRCGVRVETVPWLAGRPALDEFLDNHRLVLRHVVRHRLAADMWCEVDGVYFYGLFCGKGTKRTFNGVRLGINLAVSSTADLETGVWELWITVEPAVHRFVYLDWFDLVLEKEDKGLKDFSGSKSDALERRLQVLCLPNCTRGVVYDVQEDPFEMDRLQENNLKRGYVIGPSSEYEMVEYWRQVHLISIPPSFGFVRVQIGGMVLTYPSWCVIRRHREVPEATKALKDAILNAFTDALDAMDGFSVKETTFVWHLVSGSTFKARGIGGGTASSSTSCFDGPAFTTATGRVIGERKTISNTSQDDANGSNYASTNPNRLTPVAPLDANDCVPSTPKRVEREANQDGRGSDNAGNDLGQAKARGDEGSSPSDVTLSPGSRAAKAAIEAAVAVIRRSAIRRRGPPPPRWISPDTRATGRASSGEVEGKKESASRLCSTPFVVKRSTASSGVGHSTTQDAQARVRTPAATSSGLGKPGARGRFLGGLAKGTAEGGTPIAKGGMRVDGVSEDAVVDPSTPHAPGSKAAPVRIVTPAAAGSSPHGTNQQQGATVPSGGSAEKSQGERKEAAENVGISEAETPRRDCSQPKSATGPMSSSSDAVLVPPSPAAPSKLVVMFVAAGSLGMGLHEDETEEGSVVLKGVSPTSAAANVPTGWRITEVGGENVRRLGLEKLAPLLRKRPLTIMFEPPRNDGPEKQNAKDKASKKDSNDKVAAPSKRPAAKSMTNKPGGKKGKKPPKVTTVRKTFKVQSRTGNSLEKRTEDNVPGTLVTPRVTIYPAGPLSSPNVAVI